MKTIALVTPPLLHPNTVYAATPVLAYFLKQQGATVFQTDFSLEVTLRILTPETLRRAADKVRSQKRPKEILSFFLESLEDYCRTLPEVIAFLQGKRPELAWRIAQRHFLPEGAYFQTLDDLQADLEPTQDPLASLNLQDKAKYFASLYLDDVASYITSTLDPDFKLGQYASGLCVHLPTFAPLKERLEKKETLLDEILRELVEKMLVEQHPDVVGITIPFPGTLYGALKIAQIVKKRAPSVEVVIGGGYVNSELRHLEDVSIFDLVDEIILDDGRLPLLAILRGEGEESLLPTQRRRCQGYVTVPALAALPSCMAADYEGLDLSRYINVTEMPNVLYRIWADGTWLKMQLAQGCYWHKCAFCDVALDYIGHYSPGSSQEIVDEMERMMRETGRCGFHFVDEALSPALVRGICEEIIKRNLSPVWWGNIRFDRAFTPELADLMASAGCVAVTGGLECANDRLLALMNKGITLEGARQVFHNFAEAGILVHAYLMVGFPTETAQEAYGALDFVRRCFMEGILQSAFWHRFALTVHSPIAQNPEKFGIEILPNALKGKRFALNELAYTEKKAPDWNEIHRILNLAVYNYMLGTGMDWSVKEWKHQCQITKK